MPKPITLTPADIKAYGQRLQRECSSASDKEKAAHLIQLLDYFICSPEDAIENISLSIQFMEKNYDS